MGKTEGSWDKRRSHLTVLGVGSPLRSEPKVVIFVRVVTGYVMFSSL